MATSVVGINYLNEKSRRFIFGLVEIGVEEVVVNLGDKSIFFAEALKNFFFSKNRGNEKDSLILTGIKEDSFFLKRTKISFIRSENRPIWPLNLALIIDFGKGFNDELISHHFEGAHCGRKIIFAASQIYRSIEKAILIIVGVNNSAYDPVEHNMIFNLPAPYCCLANMVKPLLAEVEEKELVGMSTSFHMSENQKGDKILGNEKELSRILFNGFDEVQGVNAIFLESERKISLIEVKILIKSKFLFNQWSLRDVYKNHPGYLKWSVNPDDFSEIGSKIILDGIKSRVSKLLKLDSGEWIQEIRIFGYFEPDLFEIDSLSYLRMLIAESLG